MIWDLIFTWNFVSTNLQKFAVIHLSIAVLLAGLTKPGEVGKILALYRLKSLSLDNKAKLKSPCFFLQVTLFLQIIFVLW
jgi:proteasome assembly chaperone (PAC2) family protein